MEKKVISTEPIYKVRAMLEFKFECLNEKKFANTQERKKTYDYYEWSLLMSECYDIDEKMERYKKLYNDLGLLLTEMQDED